MGEAMSVDGRKKLVNMAMVTKSKGKTSGERTDVQQLREAINANCGTYRVRGRSRWGGGFRILYQIYSEVVEG